LGRDLKPSDKYRGRFGAATAFAGDRPIQNRLYISGSMRILRTFSFLSLLTACTASRDVAKAPRVNPVSWSAGAAVIRSGPDGSSVLDVPVNAKIESGWHVYSLTQGGGGPVAMSVKAQPSPPYELAEPVSGPSVEKAMDPNFGIETETYSGTPTFRVSLKLPQSAPGASSAPLELKVRSQACSDKLCLPARNTILKIEMPGKAQP
jgi:hypothetical protein